jgi:hypothetical protein
MQFKKMMDQTPTHNAKEIHEFQSKLFNTKQEQEEIMAQRM